MPSSSNAIRAGRAFVELFADDTALVRGLKRAQAQLSAFGAAVAKIGASMTAAGLAITTPLAGAAQAFGSVGDRIAKMSARTGIGVEALSQMAFATGEAGSNLETFEKGVRRMQAAITDAATGGTTTAEAFEMLGLSVDQLEKLDPQQQFLAIADAVAAIDDPTRRAALAMDVFGRAGTELVPLMSGGSEGIRRLMRAADDLGLTLSTKDAQAAEVFSDALGRVFAVVQRATVAVGAAFAPTLSALGNSIAKAAAVTIRWADDNRELLVTIGAVGAGLVATGAAVTALGLSFKVLASGVGLVASSITALGAVFGALLSPLGLVTTAVVGGVGAWLVYSDSGQQALAALASRFESFKTDAIGAFQGVVDAIAAGDLQLAGEVAMAGLNVAWQHGWNALQTVWYEFRDTLSEAWINLSAGIQVIWAELFAELSRAFPGLVEVAATAGTAIQGFFENVATSVLEATGQITAAEAEFAREFREQERTIALRAEIERIQEANADPEAFLRRELAAIEEARQAAQQARAAGTAADIRAAEDALDRARQRLQESIAAAATARANAPAPEATRINVAVPDLDAIGARLGEAADAMVAAGDQLPQALQVGSREAAEQILRSIAPGNAQNDLERRQLAEIQQSKDLLKELVDFGRSHPILRASTI